MLVGSLLKAMSKVYQPKIVIVGAGVAGISAASKLVKNGLRDIFVLEAENRIGGRVYSVPFGGTTIDLGAQWIHGEEDNLVYQMVKNLNLVDHNSSSANYENGQFFISDNSKIDQGLIRRLRKIAGEILESEKRIGKHGGTLDEYFKENFYERVSNELGNDTKILKLAKMMEEWISKFWLCLDPAKCWQDIPTKSLVLYEECEGDHLIHWGNKGFGTLLDVIMESNLNESDQLHLKNNILLNKEVKKIIWDQDSDQSKNVTIKCSDGSIYHADHVIATMSVAVLKHNHRTLFEPALPEYKINCVENIHLGTVHKIFLKFPKKWWPNDVLEFSFLWNEEDKKKLSEEFPHGPVNNNRSWLEDVFGFYTVDSHPEILLGWVVGSHIEEVELLPDELVKDASLFLLRKFAGKKYDIPEPESIIRSKWSSNPHFYGTYSYVNTQMLERKATNEDLAKPLVVGSTEVVLFAGEATHSKYFSTVHGAAETGYREANRLIKMYNNKL